MSALDALQNPVLIAAISAWGIAQIIKLPLEFIRTRSWDWSILLRTGGMPSSHSALITAAAHGAGLASGFDSPVFAMAVAIAMIVIYDATGIRRQAGRHASIINAIVKDLMEGHPLRQERLLREVLGHSPMEAFSGVLLGLVVSQVIVPSMLGAS